MTSPPPAGSTRPCSAGPSPPSGRRTSTASTPVAARPAPCRSGGTWSRGSGPSGTSARSRSTTSMPPPARWSRRAAGSSWRAPPSPGSATSSFSPTPRATSRARCGTTLRSSDPLLVAAEFAHRRGDVAGARTTPRGLEVPVVALVDQVDVVGPGGAGRAHARGVAGHRRGADGQVGLRHHVRELDAVGQRDEVVAGDDAVVRVVEHVVESAVVAAFRQVEAVLRGGPRAGRGPVVAAGQLGQHQEGADAEAEQQHEPAADQPHDQAGAALLRWRRGRVRPGAGIPAVLRLALSPPGAPRPALPALAVPGARL